MAKPHNPPTKRSLRDKPEIAAIGQELDVKLADLLDHLGLPAPLSLKGSQVEGSDGLSR
jgi:hypothetical protein